MAPTLPMRSLGQQGLKASAQGLGIASVDPQPDPIHHSKDKTDLENALALHVSRFPFLQAAWACQLRTKTRPVQ